MAILSAMLGAIFMICVWTLEILCWIIGGIFTGLGMFFNAASEALNND